MKTTLKGICLVTMLSLFSLVGSLLRWLMPQGRMLRMIQLHLVATLSRFALFVLGIRVQASPTFEDHVTPLIVANHLSYVDILIIASRYPAIFVTSQEVSDDPVLGMITRAAGCLYVERRHPFRLPSEIAQIRELLKMRVPVAFFPEGTTTDGTSILKFKSPLFEASVGLSNVKVKTLCLVYTHANEEALTPEHADQIFYYGDMTFTAQFKKLLSLNSIDVSLREVGATEVIHRKEAARWTRHRITADYFSNFTLANA